MVICFDKSIVLVGLGSLILLILTTNLIYYAFYISPQYFITKPIRPKILYSFLGIVAYLVAYALSLLRLPFAIIPYLMKLLIFLAFRTHFQQLWDNYSFQVVRVTGDLINLVVTAALFHTILDSLEPVRIWSWFYLTTLGAEAIRLTCERGQMLFSTLWQLIPHQVIARKIESLMREPQRSKSWLIALSIRYRDYYALNDEERNQYLLRVLKTVAVTDPEVAQKLVYTQSLQIVSQSVSLRAGAVRDVAKGEIFIHAAWTNDPWLLVGQTLRRTPWMYDPRRLHRPFYYRTEANRLATLFVFRHAYYSLPYTWYQFGHEIKAARYDLFYRACRWIGFNLEEPVREDGTFRFDQLIHWLEMKLGHESAELIQRPLWTDKEVISEIVAKLEEHEIPSALEIAVRYTYPLKYVQEVLLPIILDERARLKRY